MPRSPSQNTIAVFLLLASMAPGVVLAQSPVNDSISSRPNPAEGEKLFRSTKTIQYVVDPQTGEIKPKGEPPRVPQKDTVIVLRAGLSEAELAERKKAILREKKKEQFCQCLTMELIAPEKLPYSAYLNYGFKIHNRCQETMYVQSSGFQFSVFQTNGRTAKTLRSLQFSKQFKYPEWVAISPQEDYEFQFADDPFFRYDLQSGEEYIFRFQYKHEHDKVKNKAPGALACPQNSERKIFIH